MTRPLEILGIVLFRFQPFPRIWAIYLILVNLGSLVFLDTIYGLTNIICTALGIALMVIIYSKHGYVRLLGLGHIFWIPMLIYFLANLPEVSTNPGLYYWVIVLIGTNSICLCIDAIDASRYIFGERRPYYFWRGFVPGAGDSNAIMFEF